MSFHRQPRTRAKSWLSVVSSLLLLASGAVAQNGGGPGKVWIQVQPGAPEGSPVVAEVVAAQSSAVQTIVDVSVPGYWHTVAVGTDGIAYDRIEFPGADHVGVVGSPEMPCVRLKLAIGSSALSVTLAQIQTNLQSTFPATTVYPTPTPALEQDGGIVIPEQFTKDAVVYATDADFPAQSYSFPVALGMGGIRTANVVLAPARFNPVTHQLKVFPSVRYVFSHSGTPLSAPSIPKDLSKLAAAEVKNWPTASNTFTLDTNTYHSNYLIVTPAAFVPQLEEFVKYRKTTGHQIAIKTLESLPQVTPTAVRQAIQSWYAAVPAGRTCFCLLVGTAEIIPHHVSPSINQVEGDELYGSMNGDDHDKEVFVGRLPVDAAHEVAPMLGKIISYETAKNVMDHHDRVLLVAHDEGGATGHFEGSCEIVANASYAVQPSFVKVYGSNPASDNADINAAIDASVGIVAYRGHGWSGGWYHWNLADDHWTQNDVNALQNFGTFPVVWNFACGTHAPTDGWNNHGERLLKNEWKGAVSSFGCVGSSGPNQSTNMIQLAMHAVFQAGVTTQAMALQIAKADTLALYPEGENPWCYVLYGDPAMKIRRDHAQPAPDALPLKMNLPPIIDPCMGSGCMLPIAVVDANGQPKPGVLVSAYKAGATSVAGAAADEVFANAYTDSAGIARLPLNVQSLGMVAFAATGDDGAVVFAQVPVKVGGFTDVGDAKLGGAGLPKLTGAGSLVAGQPMSLDLTKAAANTPAMLLLSTQDQPTVGLGGVVHPIPVIAALMWPTDAAGEAHLPVAAWPSFAPGFTIVAQAAIADVDAKDGVALSNALVIEQP